MTIQGLRDTSNFVTDGRPKNWRAGILLRTPNGDSPLFALTAAMKSESVDDPEYNWWQKPMQTRRFTLGASLDSSGGSDNVTIVDNSASTEGFTGAKSLKEGDLLLVEESGELLYVNVDPTSETVVNVTRAYGSVAVTAVTYNGASVNPNLLLIGSAYEEGSDAPDGRAYDPNKSYNYTQIFRNTFEHTRTASKTRLRTGDDVKEAKRETLELHSKDIEMAFFLGNRRETTKNGKPLRITGGLKSFIPTANIKAVPSQQLAMDQLEAYMEDIFAYGSSEKMAFVGNRAMTALNQCVRKNSAYQVFAGEKVFGMKVTRIDGPHGSLVVKRHPLFNLIPGSAAGAGQTYYGMNSTMVVLDQKELVYRYFSGDDTRYEPELQANGIDGMKSGFLTECGLEVHNGLNHFWITGMNEGVADS